MPRRVVPLVLLLLVLVPTGCGQAPPHGWSPAVVQLVDDLIEANREALAGPGPRPVVAFDFDNTSIQGDIAYVVALHQAARERYGFDPTQPSTVLPRETCDLFALRRDDLAASSRARVERQIAWSLFRRYRDLSAQGGKQAGLAFIAQLFTGLTVDEVHALAREGFALGQQQPLCLRHLEPEGLEGQSLDLMQGVRVRPAMRWMMDRLRAAGFDLWIVSASPEWVVEAGAEAYGVPADHVLGTRVKLDEQGRLTSTIEPPITWRKGKIEALEAATGQRPLLAFGDSWTDFELLTHAAHGVLIQKGDADLEAALAKAGTVLLQPPFEGEGPWLPCPPPSPSAPPSTPR